MFEFAYDLAGAMYPIIREFPIAAATNLKKGEVVVLTAGKVVSAGTTPSNILGITAEDHTNSTKLTIRVYCSPTAVYKTKAPKLTATSGSTTTFAVSTMTTLADSALVAGYIKIKSATNKALEGQVYEVTANTAATGTITTGAMAAAVSANDVAMVFPPFGASFLKSSASPSYDININTTGGTAIQVVDVDPDTEFIYVKFKTQLF
jgi:hypothetical protein